MRARAKESKKRQQGKAAREGRWACKPGGVGGEVPLALDKAGPIGASRLAATTITADAAGPKGPSGAPGKNDGPDGVKADTIEAR